MKLFLFAILFIGAIQSKAQQILDFKVKTEANAKDRKYMLDLMRDQIYRTEPLDIKFVVNHFKVSDNYAWFEGVAEMKDRNGRTVDSGEGILMECCVVFCLFQKNNGVWTVAELFQFCTDVCQTGIANRYPMAPKEIFPLDEVYFME